MNVDWTGENTWPSLNLPEKEEIELFMVIKNIKKKKENDKVKASEGEQHAVSTFNAMYYFQ